MPKKRQLNIPLKSTRKYHQLWGQSAPTISVGGMSEIVTKACYGFWVREALFHVYFA